MHKNRGELATILTIATLVVLGVMTTISATVLKNKKLSSMPRATDGYTTQTCVAGMVDGQKYAVGGINENGCDGGKQLICQWKVTGEQCESGNCNCIAPTPASRGGGGGDPDPDRCIKGITSVKIEGIADGATITNRSLIGIIQTTSPKIGEFTADKRNIFGIWADGEQHPGYGCTSQPNDYGDSVTTKFTCNLPEDKVPTGKKFRVVGARLIGDKCTGDFAVTSPGTSMWGPNKYFQGPEYTFGNAAAGGASPAVSPPVANVSPPAAGGGSKFACMDCILGKNPGLVGTLVCYLNNDTNKAQCQKNMDAWCSGGAGKPAIDDCAKKKKECSAACDASAAGNQTEAERAAAATKAAAAAAATKTGNTTARTTTGNETGTVTLDGKDTLEFWFRLKLDGNSNLSSYIPKFVIDYFPSGDSSKTCIMSEPVRGTVDTTITTVRIDNTCFPKQDTSPRFWCYVNLTKRESDADGGVFEKIIDRKNSACSPIPKKPEQNNNFISEFNFTIKNINTLTITKASITAIATAYYKDRGSPKDSSIDTIAKSILNFPNPKICEDKPTCFAYIDDPIQNDVTTYSTSSSPKCIDASYTGSDSLLITYDKNNLAAGSSPVVRLSLGPAFSGTYACLKIK